jgi:hypothetical protein
MDNRMARGSAAPFAVAPFAIALLAAAVARAQDPVDPAACVKALTVDWKRATAHRDLIALGGKAVPALIDALDGRDQFVVGEVASILREIGPDAGGAVKRLKSLCDTHTAPFEVLEALTELVPYRSEDVVFDPRWLPIALMYLHAMRDAEGMVLIARLQARGSLEANTDVATLERLARSRNAFRAELAIELLARRGPTAAVAVDGLAALLLLPDPRILLTDRTVPIRERAARAILALAPDAPAAATARAVLAGTLAPRTNRAPVPERASRRAEQVVAELVRTETRAAAADNLVALGPISVPPLLAALRKPHDEEFAAAAVDVFRRLGPASVDAVPALSEMLVTRPATETVAIAHTLLVTAPWSRDLLLLDRTGSLGSISILGRAIPGPIAVDMQNDIDQALNEVSAAILVDASSTPDELRALLVDPSVLKREAALRIVSMRGPELRALLPDLAGMLDQPQPQNHRGMWRADGSITAMPESRDDLAHRLAADAILAVAAADDPLVQKARKVLAAPPPAGR